jgi:hypothetical protein
MSLVGFDLARSYAMNLIRFAFLPVVAFSLPASLGGCSSDGRLAAPQGGAPEGGVPETGAPEGGDNRPPAVKLCYTDESRAHPATAAFWSALDGANVEDRQAVIAALKTATDEHPDEEEFALLHGLANVWRLGEPLPSETNDQASRIATVTAARSSLERAYALCPTDHRITAWLGPIVINWGRALNDQATIDSGFKTLQQGIDAYPSFVLFSKLLVYADRPKSDPDFQQALAAIDANVNTCSPGDPACINTLHVPHNIEGAMVFLGDTYAKAGQKDRAVDRYRAAMSESTYGEWDYQALLADRIATVDARIAAFNTADVADDPVSAWSDTNQCSICHRR